MGAVNSTSTDLAVDVATAVTQQTNTALTASNTTASNFIATSGCTINVTGNLITDSQVTQAANLAQYGTTANNADVDTAVSQQMLQNATTALSGLALGFSGNFTSASAAVGVSSAVNEITQQTLTASNSATNTMLCADGATITVGGDWSNVSTTNQSLVATQVGNNAQNAAVSTAVDQAVSQTTSATLVGLDLNMGFIMIIVICICTAVLLIAPLCLLVGLIKHFTSFAVFGTIGGMALLGAGLIGCSFLSRSFRQPCNAHSQCQTTDNPTATCSCTDQYACGITDGSMSQKTIGVSSPPIQWLYALNDGASGLFAASLRRMAVRSFAGSDNTNVIMNNSGYNVGTYVAMKKYLMNTSTNEGGKIGRALLDFFVRKVTEFQEGGDYGIRVTPSGNISDVYQNCVEQAADVLLPVLPYDLAKDVANSHSQNWTVIGACTNCSTAPTSLAFVTMAKIPSNFVVDVDDVNASVAGCLPKVFVPNLVSTTKWNVTDTPCAASSVCCSNSDATTCKGVPACPVPAPATPALTLSSAKFTATCIDSTCYAGSTTTGFSSLTLFQTPWCYFGENESKRVASDPDPHSYLGVYNDITTMTEMQDTPPRKTLWYMMQRMMSTTLIYSNHRADQFSMLGFSTFMNSGGLNDAGTQAYPLTQDGLAAMEDIGYVGETHDDYGLFVWFTSQPLVIKENGAFVVYTLRDIYVSGKLDLLNQINSFVFKQSDWAVTPWEIALGGLASANPTEFEAAGATGASPTDAIAKMSEFGGTVVGGFGVCSTWWSSDAWINGTAAGGVGLLIGSVAWMIARKFGM